MSNWTDDACRQNPLRAEVSSAWLENALVVESSGDGYVAHTNHTLLPHAPRTFTMTPETGGGSDGSTHERLQLADRMLAETASTISLQWFQELFRTRPTFIHPGKPTGRTLMTMVAEIPPAGAPTLHLTPDAATTCAHASFDFD